MDLTKYAGGTVAFSVSFHATIYSFMLYFHAYYVCKQQI